MSATENARVRYAVVGLGNIAQVAILPAFEHARENSELAALVSSDDRKLAQLGEQYGVELRGHYDQLEDLIRRGDIHAVYIALPNTLHREHAERAARAGAHVLCETPMAVTERACTEMMRVAEEAGVKLMVAYRLHFEAANLATIELVRSGAIGEPRFVTAVLSHQVRPDNIRTRVDLGGGALYDLGLYCVNAARYLFRSEPTEAFGYQICGFDDRSRDVDDTTVGILRFPGNRVAQLSVSQGAAAVSELRVVGTNGDVRLEPAFDYRVPLTQYVTVDGKTSHRTFARRDQFAPEIVYFSRCILDGLEPEPSGAEGLADIRALQALVRSAKTCTPVEIAPVLKAKRPDKSLAMRKPPVKERPTVNAPPPSLK
jgi:predicted dehydrogenase